MLFKTPVIRSKELEAIQKIDDIKQSLSYTLSTPRRWHGLMRRHALAKAMRGSNTIEGYNVTVDEAMELGEDDDARRTETWQALMGYRRSMTYVLNLADDPHFSYSANLIKSLHFMMLEHDLTRNPGKWRPGPIFVHDEERNVRVYEGPDAEILEALMQELIRDLDGNQDHHAMVRAAMAHLNLVMIHPFSDGNGRMARVLQSLVLARTGTLAPPFSSIEEYLGRNQRAYYDVLAKVGAGRWNPERDARDWIRFCLTAHYRQAMTLLRRSRFIEKVWNALEVELASSNLPERTISAVGQVALGLRIKNLTYRQTAQVSNTIASRDLKLLVEAGFLVADGENRGRSYRASKRVFELAITMREKGPVADPFEEAPDSEPYLPGLGPS